MRKTLWKCIAVVPLLALTLWWIHSGGEAAGVSAAPLTGGAGASAPPAPPAGTPLRAVPAVPAPPAGGGDPSWRRDAVWDDGKAEFCAYQVTWAHYGHRYPGRALLVLVKEPWSPALEVKADHPGRDSFEVLKLNHVRDVATGIYTYHQMASCFWRRDGGALQKIAATSGEACGVAFAEMTRGRLETHSYFDGEGDTTRPYPAGALPEDGLPAALRDHVAGAAAPAALMVFPSLLAGRFGDLTPRTYRVERRGVPQPAEAAALVGAGGGAGAAAGAVELRLSSGASTLVYTFEAALPHRLLRFEREDGTVYRLAKCERIAYWQMHDPGGESWLPAGLR